ncbi:unannotated protein [freshwater metagenome]|uniref:Unannotated protein n=1 Tax=freshwater metagenome TaxID=449393 RepID=A0A6J6EXI8_9ZZZZ
MGGPQFSTRDHSNRFRYRSLRLCFVSPHEICTPWHSCFGLPHDSGSAFFRCCPRRRPVLRALPRALGDISSSRSFEDLALSATHRHRLNPCCESTSRRCCNWTCRRRRHHAGPTLTGLKPSICRTRHIANRCCHNDGDQHSECSHPRCLFPRWRTDSSPAAVVANSTLVFPTHTATRPTPHRSY